MGENKEVTFIDKYTEIPKEIQNMIDIKTFRPVNKGLSTDKKYYIESNDGRRLLLRINDIERYDDKKIAYEMVERAATLGIPMSSPVSLGVCDGGKSVYMLLTWCDGEDAEVALPLLPETEQYVLGIKAGRLLQNLHTLSAPDNAEPWDIWFWRKVQGRLDFYNANPIKSDCGDIIVNYLKDKKGCLQNRPQFFRHGDFNISNMIITPDKQVGVIDFNAYNSDHGDPWWEFCSIIWGEVPLSHFYTGMINGYFDGNPPHEFFDINAYYLAYDALAALCDTSIGEQGEPDDGKRHMENVLHWLDNMRNPIPTWYLRDFYIQWIDGMPYKLKSPFDFSFLKKYGTVFKVYDNQDSGNICIGISDGNIRYFVKFAGAPTERACVSIGEAVANIKRTIPIYRDLAHPNLIKLISFDEIGGGFAMIIEWVDAECMHSMYPLSKKKFMQMPLETKFRVFDAILSFHARVAEQGYVAIDFYDGSIMYDFNNEKTIICDIDLYEKAPYANGMGRLWGSSRFMSPEEFQLGAVIDEITNVYTMGATAFALFGDEKDRRIEKWKLSEKLFKVAKQAVSDEREQRQQSIAQLIKEWNMASL